MPGLDWREIFVPTVPLLELILRGSIVYLAIFAIFRVLRRETGGIGITDVLVIVLIADASQNAMSAQYNSITEGVVLVATIVGWDVFLDWLGFQFPRLRYWLEPPPLLLIRNGRFQRRNMRRELITEEDLLGKLREKGIDRVENVRLCYEESDGEISVLKRRDGVMGGRRHRPGVDS
jgi:uncharacterized membrane protein YcaP (DUF421 family)